MKKLLILLLTFSFIILLSSCTKKADITIPEKNREEICLTSGGKWDFVVCNMVGCEPSYFCNCTSDSNYKSNYKDNGDDYFIRNTFYKLENKKDNITVSCLPCNSDIDCGQDSCEESGNQCTHKMYKCLNGQCQSVEERFGNYSGQTNYDCQELKCKLIY